MDRAPLDAAALRSWCQSSYAWESIEVVDSVDSTNRALAKIAARGGAAGKVLTAETQTAGKGRVARGWLSPPRAGLAVSMLLRPAVSTSYWSWLPLLAGVAVCQALREHCQVSVALKWPNDVLLGAREYKGVGILAEISHGAVVLGVGVNVSLTRGELPRADTTSLALEGSATLDRTVLLQALLERVADWYGRWQAGHGDPVASGILNAYRTRCHTLGRRVTVSLPDGGGIVGLAADIDEAGRLCVDGDTGREAVAAGDVHHVRLGADAKGGIG